MMGAALAAIGAFLLVSAVITAAETASLLVSSPRLRTLEQEGFSGADALSEVREEARAVGASVRVVTRALNLSALGVGVASGAITFGGGGPLLDVIFGIVIVIVFADLVPHMLAARHPVRLALVTAPWLLVLTRSTRWISGPVSKLEDVLAPDGEDDLTSQERELREIRAIGQKEGVLEESESVLVERAFRLDELTAWDAMIPRVDIFAWHEDLTLAEILEALAEVPYSRVPVFRESVDDVTGIVYVREAYERIASGARDVKLRDLSHAPFFVPGSLSLAQLLRDFQAKRTHMGIVADEFGGTDGLVTLEDVLEELVGEIRDETDVEEEGIRRISSTALECEGGVDVRDINEALDVTLPKVEHRSLNGLILEILGHVPEGGESLERNGVRIEVMEATETQVVRARVTRLADAGRDDAG